MGGKVKILTNVQAQDGKINGANDIVSLTNNLKQATGILLVQSKGNSVFLPNDLEDRQAIVDILALIFEKLEEVANFALEANSGQVPSPTLPASVQSFITQLNQDKQDITSIKESLK